MGDFYLPDGQNAPLKPEEASAAFLDGKVQVKRDEPVKILSPVNGEILEVRPDQVGKLLRLGFQLPGEEQAAQHDLVQAQDTVVGMVGTAVMESANTLSFGATDAAGEAVAGEEYANWRRAQQTANPTTRHAANIGTEVVTAFATGGTSILGRQAVKAGTTSLMKRALAHTPAAIATRGIMKAEKVVANQLARNTVRRKVISQATAAAAEGAIFEGGQAVSDVSIDGREQSGAEILAAIGDRAGTGALFAGGVGGALGLVTGASLLRGKRAAGDTTENIMEKVGGKADESDLGAVRGAMQDRGEGFLQKDTTLSPKARQFANGDDIQRTPAEKWRDGAIANGGGNPIRAELSDRAMGESAAVMKANDDLMHKTTRDRTEVFRDGMAKDGFAADGAVLRTAVDDTFDETRKVMGSAGVQTRREFKQIKPLKKARKEAASASAADARAQETLSKARQAHTEGMAALKQGLQPKTPPKTLRSALSKAEANVAKTTARVKATTKTIEGLEGKGKEIVVGFLDSARLTPSGKGAARDMVKVIDGFEQKLANPNLKPEEFMNLYAMYNREMGTRFLKHSDADVRAIAEQAYEMSRQQLRNDKLFGGAAPIQGQINDAWSATFDARDGVNLFSQRDKGARNAAGTGQLGLPDAKKWNQIIREAGTQASATNEQQLYRWLDAIDNNMDVQGRYTPGVDAAEIANARATVQKMRETLDSAIRLKVDSARYRNTLQMFQTEQGLKAEVQHESNPQALIAAPIAFGLGSALGGPAVGGLLFGAGALITNLPSMAASAEKFVRKMRPADVARQAGRDAVADGITGFSKAMTRGKLRASSNTIADRSRRAIPRAARGFTRSEEEDRYAHAIRTVQRFGQDPQQGFVNMVNRLGTMPTDLPATAAAMVATVDKGARFLVDKLPDQAGPPKFGKDDEAARLEAIPVAAKLKYMRYYDAVNDPVGFFLGLRDGEVTREGVEAMQNIYPEWHSQLVAQVVEDNGERKMTRKDQAFLSTVIGVATDRTFEGSFILTLQNNTAELQEQAGQKDNQTVSPSRAQAPKQGFSELGATRAQQIAGSARE